MTLKQNLIDRGIHPRHKGNLWGVHLVPNISTETIQHIGMKVDDKDMAYITICVTNDEEFEDVYSQAKHVWAEKHPENPLPN